MKRIKIPIDKLEKLLHSGLVLYPNETISNITVTYDSTQPLSLNIQVKEK